MNHKLSFAPLVAMLFITLPAKAQMEPLQDYQGCGYVSGADMVQGNQTLFELEKGFFVTVPLDYAKPERGTTKVYAYFADAYDPSKPTLAILLGGPGQHSHLAGAGKFGFYRTLGYNFLLLEQRGIGFSRFATEDLARDARNHSSEATARDLAAVLDHLKISKVALYGTSYGTIPATIFANFFPARTTSVILEGVVYTGWTGVMMGRNHIGIIQKFYNSLPPETKAALKVAISEKRIEPYWLPLMTRAFMMQSGDAYLEYFRKGIIETLKNPKATSADVQSTYEAYMVTTYAGSLSETAMTKMLEYMKLVANTDKCRQLEDSNDVNFLLMLKEFDAGDPRASSLLTLNDEVVSAVPGANYAALAGKFTHLKENRSSYSAAQYPVRVPITYLQGTHDGATAAPGAVLHYKHAAKGPAQLLYFKGNGHMPFGEIINKMELADQNWGALQKGFLRFVKGEPLSCREKNELESRYQFKAALVSKGHGETCN